MYAVCSQCYSLVKLGGFFVTKRMRSYMWYKCPTRERDVAVLVWFFCYLFNNEELFVFQSCVIVDGWKDEDYNLSIPLKKDLQCKITIYSDRMCSLWRGSFVLESSLCTCIQSFGWKICWLGFGSIQSCNTYSSKIHSLLSGFFLHVNIVMWVNENFMCNIKLLLIFVKMKVI